MRKSKFFGLIFLTFVLIVYFTPIFHINLRIEHKPNIGINSEEIDSWSTIIRENRLFYTKIKEVNNSIYVVGEIEDDITYVTKYNSSGVRLWEYSWKRSERTIPLDFAIDSDNCLYITGRIDNRTIYVDDDDIFLLKINASGHLLWSKILNPYQLNCRQISLTLGLNNDLYISGYDYYYSAGHVTTIFLIKLNNSGEILWNRDLTMNERSPDIIEMHLDSEYNVILYVGTYLSSQYLIKFNSSGSIIWFKEWDGDYRFGCSKVILNDDILITGSTNYPNNDTVDVWIMKINSSGAVINKSIIGNYLAYPWDWFDSFWFFDEFNNVYFIINTRAYNYGSVFLLKVDFNLTIAWNCSINNPSQAECYTTKTLCDSQQVITLFFAEGSYTSNSNMLLLNLNSTGGIMNNFSWGGPDRDYIVQTHTDAQDNLYFTCVSEYTNRWNIGKDYTILVKNPKPNGTPPILNMNFTYYDKYLLGFMVIMTSVSLIALFSIIFRKSKNRSLKTH